MINYSHNYGYVLLPGFCLPSHYDIKISGVPTIANACTLTSLLGYMN